MEELSFSPDESCQNSEEEDQRQNRDASLSRDVSRDLQTALEPSLLRGVAVSVALAGWGKHWETPDSGMFRVDPQNYELSRPAETLDVFLSHDWASSRTLKFLSLLIVYNSLAAFWASLGASILFGLLRGLRAIPDEPWISHFVHLVFLVVFFFWQRMRELFCRPQMAFLDKLCIAQHSDEMKQQGILGLPAFVLNSKKLLVLWTPRYFGRLWCTTEIASFLKDPDERRSIEFMPLKVAAILVMGAVCWHLLAIGHGIFAFTLEDDSAAGITVVLPISGVMITLATAILPFIFYVGLSLVRDLEELPDQLSKFRVQDAACFCCTNKHRHPDTGAELSCDRLLVFKSLQRWFSGKEGGTGSTNKDCFLDDFNSVVQNQLAAQVVQGMSGATLPFRYTLYMVGSCAAPYLANIVPLWMTRFRSGLAGYALFAWTLRQLMDAAITGVTGICAVRLSLELWKFGMRLQKTHRAFRSRMLTVAVLVPIEVVLVSLCWLSFAFCRAATSETSLLPALPFLADVLATLYLFWPCRRLLAGMDLAPRRARRPSTGSVGSGFEI
ncbi:unnamed protein product [Symbiodinium sp. CCMP2592]|nr:unnamed protein product [Symbiodinium sp. CCMP2592]